MAGHQMQPCVCGDYARSTMSSPPLIQPRICGDYSSCRWQVRLSSDTTPRMRGLLAVLLRLCNKVRYNPAYAGSLPILGKWIQTGT